jgi:hypothetical protein
MYEDMKINTLIIYLKLFTMNKFSENMPHADVVKYGV